VNVLRTQLAGVSRRPARLLLTGLAMLVASFVVYATVLAQQITERTMLDGLSGTPAAADLVVGGRPPEGAQPRITPADLAKLQAVPGVAEAAGRTEFAGETGGQYLNITADPGSGPLAIAHVTQGRFPSAPGEIAVSPRTADRMGLPVGTTVPLITGWADDGKPHKTVRLKVTGLADARDDYGFTAYAPVTTIAGLGGADTTLWQVDLRLAAGADAAAVRSAVDRIVQDMPAPAEGEDRALVRSGAEVRTDEANRAASDLNELFAVVAMFVAIAVVAAGLVATSTFRIVFAQRMRQLALLRAIGAGRGSLRWALAAEGALTGFVAGLVGVLGALAVGHALPPLLRTFDLAVSSPGVPLLPAAGVIALSVLITVLAVLAPAFSAAKVAPLEALRAASTTGGRRDIGKARWAFGLLLALAAGACAAYVIVNLPGRDTKDYVPAPMLFTVVVSGALAFFALMALGPVLVRPVLATVGWPLRRLGTVGRLAVGGVGGAPRRAAAVSIVVALGVTLIAGVIVTGASVRVLADRELASAVPADFELTANGEERVPADLIDQAKAGPDLAHVTGYRRLDDVRIGSDETKLQVTDLDMDALPTLDKIDVSAGSLAGIAPGAVAISGFTTEFTGLGVGDTTTLTSGKKKVQVKVAAVLPDTGPLQSYVILDPSDLSKLGAPATYSGMLADAAQAGEDGRTAGLKAMQQLTSGRTGLGVQVLADERDQFNLVMDGVLAVAIGLVGLTVLIAVVGVGTTTALSVVERVRESGLLRAVGLSRGGLRAMLTAESSLYGVIGATIGLVLGIPYAWLSIKALGVNAPLALPVWQLAAVFAVLVLFTALAGVLPARRAARVSPVAALATDG
jgi:putative ABC transport system permease protein